MSRVSFNNRFIVEPYYSDRALKATQGSGFALVAQKVNLKGLKLLVAVPLFDKNFQTEAVDGIRRTGPLIVKAGSKIYIREELLHTQPWAKQLFECEGIEGKFMIVEGQYIDMIEELE